MSLRGGGVTPAIPVKYDITAMVPDTYIDPGTGDELSYNGWDSTPFLPLDGQSRLFVFYQGSAQPQYVQFSAFYDAGKHFISSGPWNGNILTPPRNAKFVRYSWPGQFSSMAVIVATTPDYILTPPVETPNMYIENGVDVAYNGWNIYRVDNEADYVSIVNGGSNYNAFYDASGYMYMFYIYARIPAGCLYMRFSNSASPFYVLPIKYEEVV